MIVLLIAAFLTIFIGIKSRKSDNIDSYLDKNQTASILGVFAVVIFFNHFFSYYPDKSAFIKIDELGYFVIAALGQLMVAPFLFFSGYGIFEQFKSKGEGYANKLPKNRILKVYLMFFLSWTLFFISSFIFKWNFSLETYLFSPIGVTSIGNSNWYVVVILVLYLTTYLSIKIGKNQKVALVINIILCLLLIFIFKKFDVNSCWWDTISAYAFGLFYSYIKPSIVKFCKKHKANRFILFGISIILTAGFGVLNAMFSNDLFYAGMVMSFAFVFASFLALFVVGNKIVLTLGQYCFWIYILQRIPMRIFTSIPQIKNLIHVCFLICIVGTGILAFSMDKLFNLLWPLLDRKKKKD